MEKNEPPLKEYEFVQLPDSEHPAGRTLMEFWRARQAEGGVVMGRDIPSRPIARLLSSLMVLEPLDGGADFGVRLAGTALRKRWGDRESTGMKLSDLFPPEILPTQLQLTNQVLTSGQPLVMAVTQRTPNQPVVRRETTLLRILAPDQTSHWILVGIFYET